MRGFRFRHDVLLSVVREGCSDFDVVASDKGEILLLKQPLGVTNLRQRRWRCVLSHAARLPSRGFEPT